MAGHGSRPEHAAQHCMACASARVHAACSTRPRWYRGHIALGPEVRVDVGLAAGLLHAATSDKDVALAVSHREDAVAGGGHGRVLRQSGRG